MGTTDLRDNSTGTFLDVCLCFSAYPPRSPGHRPLQPREDRTVSGKDSDGLALRLSPDPYLQPGMGGCGWPLLGHSPPYRQREEVSSRRWKKNS